jgi:NAD(P)-dependent dehydrogenase (short-subunit alcohol dehydrogenase family)
VFDSQALADKKRGGPVMPVALITGTSTGIGQATALYLARHGYHVFASMRNLAKGASALTAAANAERLSFEVLQLDVDDPISAVRAVQEVQQKAGQIDVLINNAGVGGGGAIEETPEERLRAIFETNFFGAMRLIRAVLPGMRERRRGAIVNVTSVAGRLSSSPQYAYAASKSALEAASEILAQEVRRFNIRVAIIEPGVVLTPIFAKNMREPDMNSPYVEFTLRLSHIFKKRLENASPPELVAATIHRALETDQPKLRYPIGEDAHQWLTGRQRMTDEEWIDYGKEMTGEDLAVFYRKYFGMEI